MRFIALVLLFQILGSALSPAFCATASAIEKLEICCAKKSTGIKKAGLLRQEQGNNLPVKTPCAAYCQTPNTGLFLNSPMIRLQQPPVLPFLQILPQTEDLSLGYGDQPWQPPKQTRNS